MQGAAPQPRGARVKEPGFVSPRQCPASETETRLQRFWQRCSSVPAILLLGAHPETRTPARVPVLSTGCCTWPYWGCYTHRLWAFPVFWLHFCTPRGGNKHMQGYKPFCSLLGEGCIRQGEAGDPPHLWLCCCSWPQSPLFPHSPGQSE